MEIQENGVVGMHCTLKNDVAEIRDSSEGSEPLHFLFGNGNIVPGLESALIGKTIKEKIDVTVEPQDGYGIRRDGLRQEIALSAFEGIDDIEVGMCTTLLLYQH